MIEPGCGACRRSLNTDDIEVCKKCEDCRFFIAKPKCDSCQRRGAHCFKCDGGSNGDALTIPSEMEVKTSKKLYVCDHAETGECDGCKHRFLHEHKGNACGPMHCPWADISGADVKCIEYNVTRLDDEKSMSKCNNCVFDRGTYCDSYAMPDGSCQVPNSDITRLDNEKLKDFGQALGVADPNGVCLGEPGCKLDAGKIEPSFALDGFPRALEAVARVGMFGAYTKGYGVNAWQSVENGIKRYREARFRHDMAIARGEEIDPESGLPHAFHSLWNHLAELELMLRK